MTDLLAWQIVDSAFPTGGFAHSWGFEAAVQQGEVSTAADVRRFVADAALQAGYGALPLVNATYDAPERVEELDAIADAFLLNPVANRASRVQGRTLLATAVRVWPGTTLSDLQIRVNRTCAHLAPVTGVALKAIGLERRIAQQIVLFTTIRAVLSAAVRLGITGSYEAQRLQFESHGIVDAVLARCGTLTDDDLAQPAPLIDLLQAGHDRLYSRLFQS